MQTWLPALKIEPCLEQINPVFIKESGQSEFKALFQWDVTA